MQLGPGCDFQTCLVGEAARCPLLVVRDKSRWVMCATRRVPRISRLAGNVDYPELSHVEVRIAAMGRANEYAENSGKKFNNTVMTV